MSNLYMISNLCSNNNPITKKKTESNLIWELRSIIRLHPSSLNARDHDDKTPLHFASRYRSPAFCQNLLGDNASLRAQAVTREGWLPFHYSCYYANVKTAKFLYRLFPESINMRTNNGAYPLHLLIDNGVFEKAGDDVEEFVRFLLGHNQRAASLARNDGSLPLHLACDNLLAFGSISLKAVKLVYSAYPEAIYLRDNNGKTPLDLASHCPLRLHFLQTQRDFINQAHEEGAVDRDGQLSIHRAIQSRNVSMGTIKLMLAENPESVRVANNQGLIPLHIACQLRHLNIVKCLVDADESTLQICDPAGNFPLHHACARGKCEMVNYILEKSVREVALHNAARKLPIELLIESKCDKKSTGYIEAIWRFLRENPAMMK